ncbi:MAG: hypothetical protein I3J02_05475 [Prevotella sp.]|nr:hypothetical protein [Prevotella sp.]
MKRCILMIILAVAASLSFSAEVRPGAVLINRIFDYTSTVDTAHFQGRRSYTYTRFKLRVDRKNPTLLLVPTVYAIAHSGEREYIGETYNRVTLRRDGKYDSKLLLRLTTVPHRHRAMSSLMRYLTPKIYDETVIEDFLLSPFHRNNRHYYRYQVGFNLDGTARLTFLPKRKNTQLVTGDAIVDSRTGRIIRCSFSGEYDMVNFWITLYMGADGVLSLVPRKCELKTRFRFIQSKVTGNYVAYFNLPQVLTDSITEENDYEKICQVRPDTLETADQAIYERMFAKQRQHDSIPQVAPGAASSKNWVKNILWDMIGDNLLNRVKTHFGMNNQGYIRLNPILNPLYMGYSERKGFTYKFDLRTSYQLGPNSEVSARIKAGYAFRQKQFYFRIPVFYYFNKRKNGYLKFETGNGNHIRNGSVRQSIEQEHPDTIGLHLPDFSLLNEFKQNDMRLIFNYNFHSRLGFQIGALYQRRVAIHKKAFETLKWETDYCSFSPTIELQVRPWGWKGPIFTADYDRSIKGFFKSNTGYERMEFNAEYIYPIHQLQSLQMRVGTGFYTWKDGRAYFLNYENFQENNIPGGWNDDWSGEFELLRGDTYNNSTYYIRTNVTYESPMMLISHLPWLGHYMEMERVYVSVLDVRNIHPYVELGYGFTTRLISCGFFVSNGRGNRTFGFKFGFELFRHW